MLLVKNICKQLITVNHDGKSYPLIPAGEVVEIPDSILESKRAKWFKGLEDAKMIDVSSIIDQEPELSERHLELKEMKVGELRDMAKDMYGITGTSRMKEDDLIEAIVSAESAE